VKQFANSQEQLVPDSTRSITNIRYLEI